MALSLNPALSRPFFRPSPRAARRAPASGGWRGLSRAARQRLAHGLHAALACVTLFTMLFPLGSSVPTAAAQPSQAAAQRRGYQPAASAEAEALEAGAGLAALSGQLLPGWLANDGAAAAPALDTALLPTWLGSAANAAAPALDTALLPAWLGSAANAAAPALDTALLPAWLPASAQAPAVGASLLPNWLAPAAANASALLSPGVCPADPATLNLQLTLPDYTVSRGTTSGDVYTVTVTNSGAVSVPEVSLLINANVGFYYLGGSATATSSLSGTQTYVDSGTGLPDATSFITLTGNSQATSLAPGETLTFTFRLATDANATSGQQLLVSLRSGDAPSVVCRTTGENVPTARGHLTIQKGPVAQPGQFGDVITWTVILRNPGLGNVYNAVFTDTAGAGLINVQVTPTPAPISLTVNAEQVYTVTAAIAACTQLTNTVQAGWSIGNADGTGTGANPVSAETDILFTLTDPDIVIEIGSLPTVSYCGPLSATVPVTVTNTGGTGRFLRLNMALGGLNLASLDPNWVVAGNSLIYQGGTPTGTILVGQVLTFSVQATTTGPVCSTQDLSIELTPIVQDACLVMQTQAPAATASTPAATAAPTLNLTKEGPEVLVAGRTYAYTLTVSGQNRQSFTAPLVITDLLPTTITLLGTTPSSGGVVTSGSLLTWTVPVTGAPGAYTETLIISFTVPQNSTCGAGAAVINRAFAQGQVCPQCATLTAGAETSSYVEDMFDQGNNDFEYSGPSLELCVAAPQPVTATLTFGNGVTWTNSIYTDTLGLGEFAQPLHVVSGSVQVLVDGQDRTSDVAISLGAPLEINLSGIGTFSTTAALTITYAVTAAAGSIAGDAPAQSFYSFARFQQGGLSGSCTGGAVAFFGAEVSLRRANLEVGVTPGALQSCRENTVVLTVDGATANTLSDSLVVTFTADPADVFTPTAPVLGGALTGQPVVVTKTGNLVTFTFPITLDLNGSGTIAFPLYRPCGVTGPLQTGLVYADQCQTTRTSGGSGAATTQSSGVSLFTTPDAYTVVDLKAIWRFYVSSVGEIAAENVIVTNTLPVGHSFYTYTASSSNAPLTGISYQTGLNGNGQVVVTVTIASLPVGGRIRFDMESRIDTACNLPAEIDIALFQSCGAVNGACGNRQTGQVQLLPSPTSLLSSNDQSANLPLCETGDVFLTIKNTSAQSLESAFTIRDIITNATFITGSASVTVTNEAGQIVTGTTSGLPLANIPFAPAVTTAGNQQVLSWTLSSFISGTAGYDVLAIRQASDRIDIHFQVRTGCTGMAVEVQSQGNALDVCQRPLTYTEEAQTLLTDAPELALVKTACNATTDDCANPANFAPEINAGAGETVVWKLRVANTGDQRVINLFVTDTAPSNYIISATLPAATSIVSNTLTWHLTGTTVIAPGASLDFLITGTVAATACQPTATNTALAYFACSDSDQCLAGAVAGSAAMHNEPNISVQVVNTSINQCGGGPLQININNTGAYANNVVISYTLPGSLRYAGPLTSTPTPAYSPTIGASGTLTWLISTLTETAVIRFAVVNQAGTCPAPPLTAAVTADGYYDDSCAVNFNTIAADAGTITFLRPNIVGSLAGGALQLPITRVVAAGQVVTWTVAMRNTGNGAAENLLITETLGVGYTLVTAGVSTGTGGGAGATPVIAGQVITWLVPSLGAGGRFTATVTATVDANPTNLHATIAASSECDNGGCFRAVTPLDKSATTLSALVKTVSTTTIPIGLPFSYTITGTLFGNYTVTNTVLTDTLPTIGGQQAFSVTAVSTASSNGNPWQPGPLGGPVLTFTTPTGAVTGPETFTFTVEGVITDSLFADNGDVFTNTVQLAYRDDGFRYSFTRQSPPVTVIEPFLAISKTVTPTTGVQAGDRVTYTLSVSHVAGSTADAFDLVITDTLPAGLVLAPETVVSAPAATSLISDSRHLTATYDVLALGGSVVISYSAVADLSIRPGSILRNHAVARWTSTADDPVGEERTGVGPDPDDHFTSTVAPFATDLVGLIKTVEKPTYTIGEGITYTIQAALPLGTIPNTVVTDTLPAGLIFISGTAGASGPGFAGSAAPTVTGSNDGSAPTTLVWNFGQIVNPITSPAPLLITFTAAVANVLANQQGLTLTNVVTTTWYNDDNTTQTVTDSVPVGLLEPTLIITKSVTPASTRAGDTVQFDIWVYHAATSTVPAYNVRVTDTVPGGLTYLFNSWDQAAGPAGSLDDGNAPTLTGFWVSIPVTVTAANPIRLRFQAQAPLTIALGSLLTNTVFDSWHSLPTNPYTQTRDGSGGVNDYRGQAGAAVGVGEVGLTKTAPLTITAGTIITYVLGAHNYGPFTATGAVVTDTMPFQVSTLTAAFSVPGGSSGACPITPNPAGDQVVCALGTMAPNVTGLITITALVPADTPEAADLTNVAVLAVTSPDGQTTNNTATTDTEVLTRADVGVTKTGPITATAGETVTYTVRVTNTGPSVARTVDVKDLLPPGMTYLGGSSSQGLCVSGICQLGDLGVNGAVTMVITASVGPGASGLVTNTAQVFGSTPDPVSANNTATAPTTIAASTRLVIDKTDLTDPVNAGSTYLYEIVLTNTGPSDAVNVVITDRLPSQVTFQGATPTCAHAGGVVTCTVGALPAGNQINFLINTLVLASVVSGTQGTNTVGVTTTTPVAAGSVLTDSEITTYRQVAGNPTDLALTKGVSPSSVTAGSGLITYTLRVTNTGPAAMTGVQVVDAFPREFEFISAASSVGLCNSGMTCDLGALAVGQSVAITLVVAVPSDVSAGVYTNTATVSGAGPETNTTNNTDSRPVTVVEQALLQLRKAANPDPATPGEALYYTIVVTNIGPSDADNVTVAETLPAGFSLSLVTSSQGGCAALPCNLGTLPAGGSASVTLAGVVAANATTVLTNVASVTSTTPGTGAVYTTTTSLTNQADLALVKSATPTALAGGTVVYTLTVYNLGPSDALGVVVTDTLPAGVTFVSASLGCAPSGGQVLCTVGALTAGAQATYSITVTVNNDVQPGTSLENTAVVGSQTPDGNPSNNADDADTNVLGLVDLVIAKSDTPDPVVAGQALTYTLVVTNSGPSTALDVIVVDALPAGVTFSWATSSQGTCNSGVTCVLGTLAAGATATITVGVTVDSGTTGPLTNQAQVTAANPESTPANNVVTATTTVNAAAALHLEKTGPATATPGGNLTYAIVVSNSGPSDAQNVVISDTLPAALISATATTSQGACTLVADLLTCNLGTLVVGASVTIQVDAVLSSAVTGALTNTASAGSPTDPTPASDTVTTTLTPRADLALVKSATPTALAGGTAVYTLTVYNLGPSDALGVVVTDTLPAGVTFGSASLGCAPSGGQVLCTVGALTAGAQATYTITVTVNSDVEPGTSLENTAVVGSQTPDDNPSNNADDADTSIVGQADVALDKSGPASAVAGEVVTYTIVITNNGPSTAQMVDVKDTLPAGLDLLGATIARAGSGPAACGGAVCQTGDLAVGEVVTVTVTALVGADVPDGALLTNNGTVFSGTSDPTPGNDTDSVTTTIGTRADVSVAKVDLADPVGPTQGLLYQLVAANAGPSDAQNVVVTDTLDANTTFVNASPGCVFSAGAVVCTVGTLPAGSSVSYLIAVTVGDVPSGTVLNNTVVVTSTTSDPNPGDNTDTEPTTVQPPLGPTADVGISKTGTAGAAAGQNVTYTLVVTNAGPQTATNVRVLELIPAGTTVVSLTADNPNSLVEDCSLGGACYLGSLAPGQIATITVVLNVDASFTGGLLTNTASVSADQADPNPANNLASAPTTITTATDLVLDKVDLADPVNAGELLLYQLVVTNAGPSDAQNVVITDTLPAGVSFMGASPLCTESAGVVVCALGALAAGQSAGVLIQVRPDAGLADGTVLTNTAATGSDTPETNPSNNHDAVPTTVQQPVGGPVDLAVAKADTPDPVIAGQTLTYTLVVTNNGPATAQDVILVDALPAGVTFASATSSQGACNSGVTCALGALAPNATATITVVVTVNSGTTGVLVNLAQVTAANPESNLTNNQAGAVTVVDTLTDLALVKTGPLTATPGAGLSYQIVVTNSGPSDAVAVVVSDTLPAALTSATAASSQGACSIVVDLLTCNLGTLAAGQSATIVVNANVAATASGVITNTATVSSNTPETNTGNNSGTALTTLAGQADLAITKGDAPDPVIAGELLTYTLTVVNNGPTAASAVTVTDQLPAGVTLVTATPGYSGPNPLVWNLGPLGVGATQTVTITVRVNSGTPSGAVLANNAGVTSDLPDPAPNNNTAGATTQVQTAADLALNKTAQPGTVLAGELVTYTLVVTNLGPSTAVGVQVLDALPAEVTLLSASTTVGVCGSGLCVLGSLPSGAVVTITLVTRAQAGLALGTTFTNTALVFSPTPDPNPGNNQDDAPVTIATSADLAVDKRHSGSAVAGQSFTYQVVVTNAGPSGAVNVVVTDTLPGGLTYSSATAACALQSSGPDVVACALGNLAAGASTSFEVTVLVDQALSGTLTNTVVVAADTPDGNPANNTDLDPTNIATLADVSVVKTATPEPVTAGEIVTYTLTVYNAGPSRATAVVVTDTLPVNVTHVSNDAGCSVLGGAPERVVCNLGALDAGQTVNLEIVVRVAAGTAPGSTLNNQAVVRSATPDPNLGNNTATALTTVTALADVVVDKSGPTGALVAGQAVTYTVVVSNAGPSAAADVDLKDFLPPGVTLVNAQTHTGAPCLGSLCQLGTLDPGATVTITLTGTVNSDVPPGTVLTNTATAFTDTPDSNPANNSDDHANNVETLARLEIEKRDLQDPVAPETQLLYWIAVTNTGPSDALNVVITDTLPANVTFMGSTGDCVALGLSQLRCTVGALPAGSTQSFFVSVLVNATVVSGTVLVNDVSVGSGTPLDPSSVLTDSEPTLVQQFFGPPADLALAKAVTPTTVIAGELITYTLVVTNYGPATAQDVEVSDALPAGLTLVSAVSSQGTCAGAVTCLLGVMAFTGQPSTATITLTARVGSGVPAGTVLTNTAFVQSAQYDPNQDNNTAQAVADVVTSADLAIAKSDAPDPVTAGERLIYTLVITNYGPSDARNVVVTDTLPAEVTFVSGDGCTDLGGGVIACALGDLAAGATRTVDLVVQVAENAPAGLNNQAVVGSDTPDPVPGNNTDSEPTTVLRAADLGVVKDVVTDTVWAGETLTYNLTIHNYGPSAAEGVVVTDTLPAQVSFVSADPAQASGPNPLLWNVGDLAVGASRSFTVVVTVLSNTLNAQVITNWAEVGATTPDPQPANNTDDAQAQVFGLADVAVQKFAPPSPVIAGDQVVYTISVHNLGPSVAEQVDVKDVLPDGLSLGALSTSQGACVGSLCQLGSLPVSTTAVITAVLNVDADVLSGTVLCNTAMDFAATPDPNSANNASQACVTVAALTDVSITKQVNGAATPGGDPFLYTLVVSNNGPSDAQDVVVSDTLPAELSFVSATPPQTSGPNPLGWNLGTLAAGATQELSVWVRAQAWVTQTFTNTAAITTTTPDGDPSNNSDDAPTGVSPLADLALVKTTDSPVAVPGNRIMYTLTVYNLGPSDAQDVVVSDTLPAEVSFVAASPTQDGGPNPLLWNLGTLPAGATRVITLTVDVLAGVEQSFRNNAVVSGSTPDPDPGNNADDVTHTPAPQVDLVLEKTVDHNPLEPDDEFFYTIVVRNDGPSVATDVRVSDLLPDEVIYLGANPAPNPGGNPLTWDLGNLAPGARVTITINAQLQPWATDGFTNTAVVTSTATETNPDNNSDDAPVRLGVPTAPINPLYFEAQAAGGRQVALRWAYASEAATSGYRVLRAPANDLGQAVEVCTTAALGAGTNYNCLDSVPQDGVWWYWLVRLDGTGQGSPGAPVTITVSSAAPYRLWLPLIGKDGQE
ncbi:MAG: DUF11 domain-containing protein [Anaerolineales bacterium]|nr:DUF11 domain-containing protein [Anaerolineales bacterium]